MEIFYLSHRRIQQLNNVAEIMLTRDQLGLQRVTLKNMRRAKKISPYIAMNTWYDLGKQVSF